MKNLLELLWRAFLNSDYWWLEEQEAFWSLGLGVPPWGIYPDRDRYGIAKDVSEQGFGANGSADLGDARDALPSLDAPNSADARRAS